MLVAISDGHEIDTAGKRTPAIEELDGRVIHENEFNKAVALKLEDKLIKQGFSVINVSATSYDTLADRVTRANDAKADIFIAIHYNALDGVFDDNDPEGLEIHICPNSFQGKRLATCVLNHLKLGTTQINRGIKESSFYVLTKTNMPAILTENGFMDNKGEALLMIDEVFQDEVATEHCKGICDYFGKVYTEPVEGTPIMGESQCTAEQLEAYLLSKNPNPSINMDITRFCDLWISEGIIEGVRGDIAFCQSCHETGYFKYGGIVLPTQNNFGGIGALNGNSTGNAASFNTPQLGIQAFIQHLKAYGSTERLVQVCVDPRFSLVTRGIAPNFEDLGGRWAYPGYDKTKYSSLELAKASMDTYGHYIIQKYEDLKNVVIKVDEIDEIDYKQMYLDLVASEVDALDYKQMYLDLIKNLELLIKN